LTSGKVRGVSPSLDTRRIAALSGPANAQVVATCSNGKTVVLPITLLPLPAWDQRREYALATAAFVFENDPFVLRVLRKAEANPSPQSGSLDPKTALGRIYDAVFRCVEVCYLYERGLLTGSHQEQYLRFPSQIHWDQGGTCIDLALMLAAASLAAGLRPVIAILGEEHGERHAVLGLRLGGGADGPVLSADEIGAGLADGNLLVCEATAITEGRGFQSAIEEGARRISSDPILWGIDVEAARNGSPQIRSLPEAAGDLGRLTDAYTTTHIRGSVSPLSGLRLSVATRRTKGDSDRHWDLAGYAVTIGRGPHNRVRLVDPTVAREHALLFVKGGKIALKDLGSATGTFIDGRRLEPDDVPPVIAPGATIRAGLVDLRLDVIPRP